MRTGLDGSGKADSQCGLRPGAGGEERLQLCRAKRAAPHPLQFIRSIPIAGSAVLHEPLLVDHHASKEIRAVRDSEIVQKCQSVRAGFRCGWLGWRSGQGWSGRREKGRDGRRRWQGGSGRDGCRRTEGRGRGLGGARHDKEKDWEKNQARAVKDAKRSHRKRTRGLRVLLFYFMPLRRHRPSRHRLRDPCRAAARFRRSWISGG